MAKRKSSTHSGTQPPPPGEPADGPAEPGESVHAAFTRMMEELAACADEPANRVLALVDDEAERAEQLGRPELGGWARFLRARAHLLARGRVHSLLQLALLEGESSAVTAAAEAVLASGSYMLPVLRHITNARRAAAPTGCLRTLEGHHQAAVALALHPDGRRVISAGVDDAVRVWDLTTGVCRQSLPGHKQGVTVLVLHPDRRRLLVAGGDGSVRVWDLESERCLFAKGGHLGRIEAMVLHPDGRRMITAGRDRMIRVWSVEDGTALRTFKGHANVVTSLVVHPDGRRLLSSSDDRTIKVWDLEVASGVPEREARADAVVWVGFAWELGTVCSVSFAGTLKVWSVDTGECLRTIDTGMKHVRGVAVKADGRRVVLISREGSLVEWSVATGACMGGMDYGKVQSAQVSPDGRYALLYPGDSTCRAWEMTTGRVVSIIEIAGVSAALPLTNGRVLILLKNNKFNVQDVQSGVIQQWVQPDEAFETAGRLWSDGVNLISIRDDCTAQFVSLETGHVRSTSQPHDAKITTAACSPDSPFLVTGSRDKSLRVWDLQTGAMLARWDSDVPITASAVGPESHIALGDALGNVQIFRCQMRRNSLMPPPPSPALAGLASRTAAGPA